LRRDVFKLASKERMSPRRALVAFLISVACSRLARPRDPFKLASNEWTSLRRLFVAALICVASSLRRRRPAAIPPVRATPSATFAMSHPPCQICRRRE
jgi:hypothetical protein